MLISGAYFVFIRKVHSSAFQKRCEIVLSTVSYIYLQTMINSFRCSDLVSLLGSVGRNRSGRKNELQARAIEILKNPSPDINLELFKRKIRELYKAAQ